MTTTPKEPTTIIDVVPGRHVGHAAGPFPTKYAPKPDDYVGYMRNIHGEEMIFVQRKGTKSATLYHSDMDWQPIKITDANAARIVDAFVEARRRGDNDAAFGMSPAVILNGEESAWLLSCWRSSAYFRPGGSAAADVEAKEIATKVGRTLRARYGTAIDENHPNSSKYRDAMGSIMLTIGVRAGQLGYENNQTFVETVTAEALHEMSATESEARLPSV